MSMKPYTERRLNEVIRDRFRIDMNMPSEYPPIKARHTDEGGVRDRFFAAKAELPKEITVIRPFNTDAFEKSNANTVYVAPDGDDTACGCREKPLATLNGALDRMKGKKGGKIVFRGGDYSFDSTSVITEEHSGAEESPLIITREPGEKPRISTSHNIPASAFAPLTDESKLARLKESARGSVVVADLKALGITEYGTIGYGGAMLLVNSEPMTLCRFPNVGEDMIKMSETIYKDGGKETGESWEIPTPDCLPSNWEDADDLYIYGSLAFEWEHGYMRIGKIDRENGRISGVDPSPYSRGFRYDVYNTYCFMNVFEELDAPGEWYLDRKEGKLYIIPKNGSLTSEDSISLVTKSIDIINCVGASYVLIDRLNIGRCAGAAVKLEDCTNVLVQRCHFIGTCSAEEDRDAAFMVNGGFRSGVIASKMEHCSNRAAVVEGGDRKTLTPGNNFMQNCVVINPHLRFGVSSAGCGNVISHNYIKDTTMGDSGHNEGILEYNVIEGGDTQTHDTGMIYIGGGGCSSCANHYRYNYLFDFAKGDYGIYFDDLSRGMYAYGNIVVGNGEIAPLLWESGGRSFNFHNGGEHCYYENISIDAGYFAFGGDISYYMSDDGWNGLFPGIKEAAEHMGSEKYFGRNPTYKDYCDAISQYVKDKEQPGYKPHDGAAEERLRKPYAINIENNLILRAARPYKLDNGEESATNLDTNIISSEDPGFINWEKRDYRFREDAPVYDKIPGFTPPPFEKMGPVDDE